MLLASDLSDLGVQMVIAALFMVVAARYLFDKLDSKGEIKEAAQKKAVSKILNWFK